MVGTRIFKIDIGIAEIIEVKVGTRNTKITFLDPVGSLVSTLWVGWWVGCHTFSKFVYFECCSVVMMVY